MLTILINTISYLKKVFNEPMSHLFIISDEFAKLKSEQPDFMKELVSTARIGRWLRYYINTCDTKTMGVVDDQIWSNSKISIGIEVQDRQDSNEILKRRCSRHYITRSCVFTSW